MPANAQLQMAQETVIPWQDLHLDFHRAIHKRLKRRGAEHLMPAISGITDIERLDPILEALLESRSMATIHTLI